MPDQVCSYSLRTLDLLMREGFVVEEHHLETGGQTGAFKAEHGVATTQTFVGGWIVI